MGGRMSAQFVNHLITVGSAGTSLVLQKEADLIGFPVLSYMLSVFFPALRSFHRFLQSSGSWSLEASFLSIAFLARGKKCTLSDLGGFG